MTAMATMASPVTPPTAPPTIAPTSDLWDELPLGTAAGECVVDAVVTPATVVDIEDPEAEAEEDPPVMENSPEALPESPKTTKFSLVRVTVSEKQKVRLTDDDVVVTVLDFWNRYINLTV